MKEEHFPEAAVGRKTQKCRSQVLMVQKEMLKSIKELLYLLKAIQDLNDANQVGISA